jgi:hypothetical protein
MDLYISNKDTKFELNRQILKILYIVHFSLILRDERRSE